MSTHTVPVAVFLTLCAAGAAASPPPQIAAERRSITWAHVGHDERLGIDRVSCHGKDRSCDAYQGDTPCSARLPLLCLKVDGRERPPYASTNLFYDGWVRGELRATAPVVGYALESPQAADAICRTAFGPGWRIAEHHDGGGGWGYRGYGQLDTQGQRLWIRINDQPANCWDAPAPSAPAFGRQAPPISDGQR